MNLTIFNPNPFKIDVTYKQPQMSHNKVRILLKDRNSLRSAAKGKFGFEIATSQFEFLSIILNTNSVEQAQIKLMLRTQYEVAEIPISFKVVRAFMFLYPSVIGFDPYLNDTV